MADQFPRGKFNDDDEGELAVRMAVRDRTLVIDFGKPVVWVGLDKATATALANNILKRCEEL